MARERTEQPQHDDLAGAGVAADADLPVDAARSTFGAGDHHEEPAGVLPAGLGGDLDDILGVIRSDHDD